MNEQPLTSRPGQAPEPDWPSEVAPAVLAALRAAERERAPARRPFVTLAWAQSVDGCLAAEPGQKLALSGEPALRVTHALRAAHAGILVGIGTVLSDDPQLTVRLVDGPSPRPIVLDSRLRTPPGARLLGVPPARAGASHERRVPEPERSGAIVATVGATAGAANAEAAAARGAARGALEAAGAQVLEVAAWPNGWVDPDALLAALPGLGIMSVMVEGGARVLTTFLRAGLADFAVVTIAPRWIGGGLRAIGAIEPDAVPRLAQVGSARAGVDVLLWGRP
jgi:3,4-dihydroxy 2-butanone 4-phosphate synthase/GTP cyclohydrolase II